MQKQPSTPSQHNTAKIKEIAYFNELIAKFKDIKKSHPPIGVTHRTPLRKPIIPPLHIPTKEMQPHCQPDPTIS